MKEYSFSPTKLIVEAYMLSFRLGNIVLDAQNRTPYDHEFIERTWGIRERAIRRGERRERLLAKSQEAAS